MFSDTDTTKPTVTGRTPAAGATGVAVGANATATFSEAVQAGTIAFELRNAGGTLVPAATAYDAASRTVTLDPNAALAPSTTYTATLTGARDPAGNQMDPVTWTFTTETPDTTKPTVTSRTPAPGATNVAVGTAVSAVLSEAVQQSSIAFELRNAGGTLVPSSTAWNAATRTATLTPTAVLAASTTFTASLSGAQDPSGNTMDPVTWSFTTETPDTTKPTVTARTPAPGATGVAVGTAVTATFSEALQAGTVALELRTPANALVPSTTAYDAATRTVTLTPTGGLSPSTTYTANLSSARDPSGNTMDPVSWSFTTLASSNGCPCTIWPSTATPARTDSDRDAVELGVRFRASTSGFVTGIRFYKPVESTGVHVGSLWSNTGTRLANVTFTNETASGWQQASFATPVAVTAGTTYVASYFTPSRYVTTSNYFTAPTTRGPLTALQDGTDGSNGVYRYTATAGAFPNQTFNQENYWVDVVFADTDTTKPTVSGRTPAPGATGVAVGTAVTATFDEAVDAGSITFELRTPGGALVPSTSSYAAGTRTATLTPSAALAASTTYTASLTGGRDAAGNVMDPVSWAFTTETPDTTAPTVTGRTPAAGATGVSVGTTVTATFSEAVQQATIALELRAPGGAVVPAGTAWNATTRTITLTPSAALAASTTYTVELSGTRDVSGNQMAPVTWTFTTEAPDTTKPTVTGTSPAAGATGVATGTTVTATFGEAVQQATIAFELRTAANVLVTSTTAYNATTRTATLTPGAALAAGATYTARVSGARDTAGNQMDPLTWTFTTTSSSFGCPCSIWPSTAVPDRTDSDTASVELGVKFRASTNGFITGIRYYKPSVSTGTHVGSLWTGTGTRLGDRHVHQRDRQRVAAGDLPRAGRRDRRHDVRRLLLHPVPVRRQLGLLPTTATTRGPLTALANGTDGGNGLYRYTGTAWVFPTSTYNSENYWVDVVFAETATDSVAPAVTARTPATGATGVPATTRPSATFSEAVTPASISMVLRHSGTKQVVSSSTGYDAGTYTATLTPTAQLAYSTGYTVTVSGARDAAGNAMAPVTWSFETSAPPPPPIDAGPGGPMAVVTSDANKSSSYLVEIARAEGLNEFTNRQEHRPHRRPRWRPTPPSCSVTSRSPTPGGGADVVGRRRRQPGPDAARQPAARPGRAHRADRHRGQRLPAGRAGHRAGRRHRRPRRCSSTARPTATRSPARQASPNCSRRASAGPASRRCLASVGTNGGQVATFAYDLARR